VQWAPAFAGVTRVLVPSLISCARADQVAFAPLGPDGPHAPHNTFTTANLKNSTG